MQGVYEPMKQYRENTIVFATYFAKQKVGEPYRKWLTEEGEWKNKPPTKMDVMECLQMFQRQCNEDFAASQRLMAMLGNIVRVAK